MSLVCNLKTAGSHEKSILRRR